MIIDFIKKYKERNKNQEIIKNRKPLNSHEMISDYVNRINFHLCYSAYCPATIHFGGPRYTELLELDEEDIQYLINKYSRKLNKELQETINESTNKILNKYNL